MSTATANGNAVDQGQRFDRHNPCPKCGGYPEMKRGQGKRCTGFYSGNGQLVFCERVPSEKTILSATGTLYQHPNPSAPPDVGRDGSKKGQGKSKGGKTYPTADAAIEALGFALKADSVKTYAYHDTTGKIIGGVIRLNFSDGNKDYRPLNRLPNGRWQIKAMAEPRPLYRLHELATANLIIVCEGEKACDAVRSLGLAATTAPHGAKSPSKADWSPLAGKTTALWADNDEAGEHYALTVHGLLDALDPRPTIKSLRPDGLPPKGDAVEWIQQGGTKDDLLRLIVEAPELEPLEPKPNRIVVDSHTTYTESDNAFSVMTINQKGEISFNQLSDFTARITEEIERHEAGGEIRRQFRVLAIHRRGTIRDVVVDAKQYETMSWVGELLGARFTISAGRGLKDHLRAAIQRFSDRDGIKFSIIYTSTGWIKHNNEWVYLHAGGAIGAKGPSNAVQVEPDPALAKYRLPNPSADPKRIQEYVQACLNIHDLGEGGRPNARGISAVARATAWRSVIDSLNASIHFSGTTGSFKTSVGCLIVQHFAPEHNHATPTPANWDSTSSALQALAHAAKDTLLLVDDLIADGPRADQQLSKASSFLSAQGNQSGRRRARSDGTLTGEINPRGTIVSTGETNPSRRSAMGRTLVVRFTPDSEIGSGSIDRHTLTRCQTNADAGLYAGAMAAFIQWLANGRLEKVRREHKTTVEKLRAEAFGQANDTHPRHPGILAELHSGFRLFLRFAVESKVISEIEATELATDHWIDLQTLLIDQARNQADADPGRQFLECLKGALTSRMAYMADVSTNDVPDGREEPCGWYQELKYQGEIGLAPIWVHGPNASQVGWIDGEHIYLNRRASFYVAQRIAKQEGRPLSEPSPTWARLAELGIIAVQKRRKNDPRVNYTVRKRIKGTVQEVARIAIDAFWPDEEEEI